MRGGVRERNGMEMIAMKTSLWQAAKEREEVQGKSRNIKQVVQRITNKQHMVNKHSLNKICMDESIIHLSISMSDEVGKDKLQALQ